MKRIIDWFGLGVEMKKAASFKFAAFLFCDEVGF